MKNNCLIAIQMFLMVACCSFASNRAFGQLPLNFETIVGAVTVGVVAGNCNSAQIFVSEDPDDGSVFVYIKQVAVGNPFNGYVYTSRRLSALVVENSDIDAVVIVRVGKEGTPATIPSSIGSIVRIGDAGVVVLSELFCSGDVDIIEADSIANLRIQGDLWGMRTWAREGYLTAGSWYGDNVIEGSVRGNIILGRALDFDATVEIKGKLGATSQNPILFNSFGGLWGSVTAGEVNATINAFEVRDTFRTTSANGESGNFNGLFQITNALTASGAIEIAGSLGSGAMLEFRRPNAIAGRITINHELIGGDWDGEIRLDTQPGGSNILISPEYSLAAAAIGGGSIGVVPFLTHLDDSIPAFGSLSSFSPAPQHANYAIRHYGEITRNGNGDSVLLQRRALCGGLVWEDVTEKWDFSYQISSDRSVLTMTSNEAAHFRNGYEYRFAVVNDPMVTGAVLCDLSGVSILPGVSEYPATGWFAVGNSCPADFDGGGTVDLADLNAVLAAFDTTGVNLYADANGDGSVDLADLNKVLSAFDSLCCDPNALMGGGVGDQIAIELGFTCVDGLCDSVAMMSPQDREDLFVAILAEAAKW